METHHYIREMKYTVLILLKYWKFTDISLTNIFLRGINQIIFFFFFDKSLNQIILFSITFSENMQNINLQTIITNYPFLMKFTIFQGIFV